MNPLAWLNPGRWMLYAALAAALLLGYQHWENVQREVGRQEQKEVDQAATDKIKAEARAALAAETAKVQKANDLLKTLVTQTEVDRDKAQQSNADNARALADVRLRFRAPAGGCGPSGGGSQGGTGTSPQDSKATYVELPEPISRNIRKLIEDADSLLIDYGVLYTYVSNPKLVCELRE